MSVHLLKAFGAIVVVGLTFPGAADAAGGKLDEVLRREAHKGKRQRVIVRAAPGTSDALRDALKACQHAIKSALPLVEAVAVEVRGD